MTAPTLSGPPVWVGPALTIAAGIVLGILLILTVGCDTAPAEDCDTEADEDGDGRGQCGDFDCEADPLCGGAS